MYGDPLNLRTTRMTEETPIIRVVRYAGAMLVDGIAPGRRVRYADHRCRSMIGIVLRYELGPSCVPGDNACLPLR